MVGAGLKTNQVLELGLDDARGHWREEVLVVVEDKRACPHSVAIFTDPASEQQDLLIDLHIVSIIIPNHLIEVVVAWGDIPIEVRRHVPILAEHKER